jgi:hypothetical protein
MCSSVNGQCQWTKARQPFYLSLLVYPTFISSAMLFFWVCSSVEGTHRQVSVRWYIFFESWRSLTFCLCLMLLTRRQALLFLAFLCCHLQRHDDQHYNNIASDGIFLVSRVGKWASVGSGPYFVFGFYFCRCKDVKK